MIKRKFQKYIRRLVLVGLILQVNSPCQTQCADFAFALTLPTVVEYFSGVAIMVTASKCMPNISTSMDEISRTMYDQPKNNLRWSQGLIDFHLDGYTRSAGFDTSLQVKRANTKMDVSCGVKPGKLGTEMPRSSQIILAQNKAFNIACERNPQLAKDVECEMHRCMRILKNLNHSDLTIRVYARIALASEQCRVQSYHDRFEQVKNKLLKYCFDGNGNLINIDRCNSLQKKICAFIRNLPKEYHHYEKNFPIFACASERWANLAIFTDMPSTILKQQSNLDIKLSIELMKKGNFVEAERLISRSNNSLAKQIYHHEVGSLFLKHKQDPMVRALKLSDMTLQYDAHQLKELHDCLVMRSMLKDALCKAWEIQPVAPQVVHDMVYKLCDLNHRGELYVDARHIADRLQNMIALAPEKDRSLLISTFYLPNGLLKDRANHPGVKGLSMPDSILHHVHAQQRTDLNKLFLIEQLVKDEFARDVATKGIDCIRLGLESNADLQQKYFECAHAVYEALLSKNIDEQKKLLINVEQLQSAEQHISPQISATLKKFDGAQADGLGDQTNKSKVASYMGGSGAPPPNDPRNNRPQINNSRPDKNEVDSKITKVNNMKEFFQTDFGSTLKGNIQKTNQMYQGQAIYEVTAKVSHALLKRGDLLYLDALHKDHLEVFTGRGKIKAVLNLDGSLNDKKTNVAQLQNRALS